MAISVRAIGVRHIGGGESTGFGIFSSSSVGGTFTASPLEELDSTALSVVIGWAWTVPLVVLVMSSKPNLEESGEEEDEAECC
jgi:hypothetical protein